MKFERFQSWHLDLLAAQGVQAAQMGQWAAAPAGYRDWLVKSGPAVTVFDDHDRIMICGGVMLWGQMGTAWALCAEGAGRHMIRLHRAARRFLDMQRLRRIEASVEEGFTPGSRWLAMLGFSCEGRSPGYGPSGEAHLRFGRVS